MQPLPYEQAPVPVRDDLAQAHQQAWELIAKPGTWFSGAERVAIAAEARHAYRCALCQQRQAAISPYAVDGEHDQASELLSTVAVDVIHRVVTDPGRLSKRWFDETLAAGLSDAQYVEIVGVVVKTMTVDFFCQALGVPLHALPAPRPGEPSEYRPATAMAGAWVPMIDATKASGPEADLYPSKGVPYVARALSLVPDEVRSILPLGAAQYAPGLKVIDVTWERSLSRAQMELIAARVSALNQCFY